MPWSRGHSPLSFLRSQEACPSSDLHHACPVTGALPFLLPFLAAASRLWMGGGVADGRPHALLAPALPRRRVPVTGGETPRHLLGPLFLLCQERRMGSLLRQWEVGRRGRLSTLAVLGAAWWLRDLDPWAVATRCVWTWPSVGCCPGPSPEGTGGIL